MAKVADIISKVNPCHEIKTKVYNLFLVMNSLWDPLSDMQIAIHGTPKLAFCMKSCMRLNSRINSAFSIEKKQTFPRLRAKLKFLFIPIFNGFLICRFINWSLFVNHEFKGKTLFLPCVVLLPFLSFHFLFSRSLQNVFGCNESWLLFVVGFSITL